jgi:hypothetical protein
MDATASCPTDLRYSKLHFILKFAYLKTSRQKQWQARAIRQKLAALPENVPTRAMLRYSSMIVVLQAF